MAHLINETIVNKDNESAKDTIKEKSLLVHEIAKEKMK